MEGGVPAPPEAALVWVAEAAGSPVVALEELPAAAVGELERYVATCFPQRHA